MATQTVEQAKAKAAAPIHPVFNQAVIINSQSREQVIVHLTLPGNISSMDELEIEFGAAMDGNSLIVWVPRGNASCNVDILKNVLVNLSGKGVTEMDSFLFTRAIEDSMMSRRSSRNQTIRDPFTIGLAKACDVSKKPIAAIYRSGIDNDTCCVVILDVPSANNYGSDDKVVRSMMMF